MSYCPAGYFGNPYQVRAINESLKASAQASPEQLYPPLQPVRFKENGMYTSSGSVEARDLLSRAKIAAGSAGRVGYAVAAPQASAATVTLPVIGTVKRTHLYIGAAAIAGFIILKKMKKI